MAEAADTNPQFRWFYKRGGVPKRDSAPLLFRDWLPEGLAPAAGRCLSRFEDTRRGQAPPETTEPVPFLLFILLVEASLHVGQPVHGLERRHREKINLPDFLDERMGRGQGRIQGASAES